MTSFMTILGPASVHASLPEAPNTQQPSLRIVSNEETVKLAKFEPKARWREQ